MKRTSLIFSLLLALGATSYAQVAQKQAQPPNHLSKSDLKMTIEIMNAKINSGQLSEAHFIFGQIDKMLITELKVLEYDMMRINEENKKGGKEKKLSALNEGFKIYNEFIANENNINSNIDNINRLLLSFSNNIL